MQRPRDDGHRQAVQQQLLPGDPHGGWKDEGDGRILRHCPHQPSPHAPQLMARPFGIGWLATKAGRSVHTIRWYERQGLLPGVTRDAGGRRVYLPEHVQWLALMDRLRL